DEIDKIGASFHGDPASALLEVLDPEQNATFRDHYLDVPFDLSKVLFIATANIPDTIPGPLMDRMEVIHIPGYIMEEKIRIATRHLLPKLLQKHGLPEDGVKITSATLRRLIQDYAREAGVRSLEKTLSQCLRKIATRLSEGMVKLPVTIGTRDLTDLVGKPRFVDDPAMTEKRPGVVTGLAWTPFGGAVLYVESIAVNTNNPGLTLTGQLGDVMKESSHIAHSYVRAKATEFNIPHDFLEKHLIHLHVPAGATPKDGPSAGITMATSLISLATGMPVPKDWAMTGEITLTGRVLPVGGIREKLLAAKRAGIKNVILPKNNERDVSEIPANIRKGLRIHFVEDYPQVYRLIFRKRVKSSSS
ncbi:MAG: AAA family ATPase, partial [Lentisphaerae bacterium]